MSKSDTDVLNAASVWVCPGCGSHVGDHDCPAAYSPLDVVPRLRRWADARERRNPFGHGKTGTALLREAAVVIAEQDREIARLKDERDEAREQAMENA